jgi:cell division protein FtsL
MQKEVNYYCYLAIKSCLFVFILSLTFRTVILHTNSIKNYDLVELETRKKKLEKEISSLMVEYSTYNSLSYIESVARDELGFIDNLNEVLTIRTPGDLASNVTTN